MRADFSRSKEIDRKCSEGFVDAEREEDVARRRGEMDQCFCRHRKTIMCESSLSGLLFFSTGQVRRLCAVQKNLKRKKKILAGVSCPFEEYYKDTNFAYTEEVLW